ncbi:MAG: aminotransferase class I/II-fold pyridoxal phosphate-dependent enzyme [Pseudomonadota bacterium]
MNYSPLTKRIAGESVDAWALHSRAQEDFARGEDVIVLSVGDPDFATPRSICETAVAAIRGGDTHYASMYGRDALRDAIASDHAQRSGQSVTRDNVIVLAGGQNALFSAFQCTVQSGDEVIVLKPGYLTYEACIRIVGAEMVAVDLDADNGFRLNAEALKAAITPRTRAILYASPSNPTGLMLSRDDLNTIASLAIEHDLWVVADEVYCDLVFEGEHICIAGLPGMAERTITVNSLSKSHAMTGWRIGWTIGPVELTDHIYNLSLCMLYGLPGFSQEAALHALTDAKHEAARMRDIYLKRRDILVAAIGEIDLLDCLVPQAAMYLMVDVRKTGMPANEFATALYDATGVSTLDATAFGRAAEGYLRVSFTLSEDSLREACRRIKGFMQRFQNLSGESAA